VPRATLASHLPCSGTGRCRRRQSSSRTSCSLARIRFEIVYRRSPKRPSLVFPPAAGGPPRTGKDTLGWDQAQARTWDAVCRHTALAALAQLRGAGIRNALCGDITLPPPPPGTEEEEEEEEKKKKKVSRADPGISLGDAPVPRLPGQPCPPRIGAIKLTIAETARLTRLARQHTAGLISSARLAFCLHWSRWRRRH
jgi:hypothetical protein